MRNPEKVFEFACDRHLLSIFIALGIPYLFYWILTRKRSYWEDKGIKYVRPPPLFGISKIQTPYPEIEVERYKKLGRIYGHFDTNFSLRDPALTIGDPNLLRDILMKDFTYFQDRRNLGSQDTILKKTLSSLKGQDWKRIRAIVSPTFSTGKLKRVVSVIKDCSKTLLQNFKKAIQNEDRIEVTRLFEAFTMDVIASSAFSTKIDSHNDPDNEFVKNARKFFFISPGWKTKLMLMMPDVVKELFFLTVSRKLKFFTEATVQIIADRKRTGQTRNDLLQLMIDAAVEAEEEDQRDRGLGDIAENYGEDSANHPFFKIRSNKRLTTDELVAQCAIFFIAGYLTTSAFLGLASYLLALNDDVQEKAFQEISDVLQEHNGKLTYEALHQMKYLDNVISEVLRLYPPVPRLERVAHADYKLGDTGFTIPKGLAITVPVFAMHRDPQFFSNPDQFNPDRFNEERFQPYTYMPFGLGPRNCVGMRFALLETKVALLYVLSTFHLKKCLETKVPLDFTSSRAVLHTKEIILKIEVRKECPLKE